MRREGTLGRLFRRIVRASSPSWLKSKFRFVTAGINSRIRPNPSLLNLFLTSLSPLIRFTPRRYVKISMIS